MKVEKSADKLLTLFGDFDAAIRRSNARTLAERVVK